MTPAEKAIRDLVGILVILWLSLLIVLVLITQVFSRDPKQEYAFKNANVCPSTGLYGDHPCPGYVVNHKYPLCLGGKDEAQNMEYQEIHASYRSDRLEREACAWKKKYEAMVEKYETAVPHGAVEDAYDRLFDSKHKHWEK